MASFLLLLKTLNLKTIIAGLIAAVIGGMALIIGKKNADLAAADTQVEVEKDKVTECKDDEKVEAIEEKVKSDEQTLIQKENVLKSDSPLTVSSGEDTVH